MRLWTKKQRWLTGDILICCHMTTHPSDSTIITCEELFQVPAGLSRVCTKTLCLNKRFKKESVLLLLFAGGKQSSWKTFMSPLAWKSHFTEQLNNSGEMYCMFLITACCANEGFTHQRHEAPPRCWLHILDVTDMFALFVFLFFSVRHLQHHKKLFLFLIYYCFLMNQIQTAGSLWTR